MVYLFLAEGFEEIEALTPVDLLRRANIDIATVGCGGTTVIGAHGIEVTADMDEKTALSHLDDADIEMVILPGGMPGTKNLDANETVDAFLARCREERIPVAAICAAPMVLGKRGMLEGKKAVCYPGFEEYLYGAEIVNVGSIRDEGTVCGRAMGSAAEFALDIIAALRSEDAANKVREAIIL